MDRPADYLICYDICNSKRLRRVHHLVRDTALPVQFSVFEASFKQLEVMEFIRKIKLEIDVAEDKVELFKLSPAHTRIWVGNVLNNGNALIF